MGGEDLTEDDILWSQPVRADAASSDDDGDDDRVKQPARKKAKTPQQLLIQAGRDLDKQDTTEQAVFLTTAASHYRLLEGDSKVDDADDADGNDFKSHHLVKAETGDSLAGRIRNIVSVNRMKQWKPKSCPCVLIVCISARRAVEILKELAPLKLRAFKLFPKSGTIAEQTRLLQDASPCPIAVGTPHRLLHLASVLRLDETQLVVLDGQCSNKQYTVCTLPDTAPQCMSFLQTVVLKQIKKRNKCKIACF